MRAPLMLSRRKNLKQHKFQSRYLYKMQVKNQDPVVGLIDWAAKTIAMAAEICFHIRIHPYVE